MNWFQTTSLLVQVDFHAIAKVQKFVMLGGGEKKDCYVKTFRLLYSNDTRWWQVYSHPSGEHKVMKTIFILCITLTLFYSPCSSFCMLPDSK